MPSGPPCCRCGGPTRRDSFGQGVCRAGLKARTCGHWWRRDGGCKANWNGPVNPSSPGWHDCPLGCRWDHALFFTPTHTSPDNTEHLYHSPAKAVHTPLAVLRPKGTGRRMSEMLVSVPMGYLPHHSLAARRAAVMYG